MASWLLTLPPAVLPAISCCEVPGNKPTGNMPAVLRLPGWPLAHPWCSCLHPLHPQVEAVSPAAAAGSGKWAGESQAAELTTHRLDADAVLLRTTVFGPGKSGDGRIPGGWAAQGTRATINLPCIHPSALLCSSPLAGTPSLKRPAPTALLLPCCSGCAGMLARGPRRHHCGHLLQPPEQGAHLVQRVSSIAPHARACHAPVVLELPGRCQAKLATCRSAAHLPARAAYWDAPPRCRALHSRTESPASIHPVLLGCSPGGFTLEFPGAVCPQLDLFSGELSVLLLKEPAETAGQRWIAGPPADPAQR